MPEEEDQSQTCIISKWLTNLLGFSGLELLADMWQIGQETIKSLLNNGIYEVLDYESTLEIHNQDGTKATFIKRKKIRYLQNNIIAYQDYAWGDGEILLNYRTNRGKPVDRYRSGYKTYILLSLREVKNRGDTDEFNIQWNIRRGFLTNDGYWSTDISHPTRHIKINVIFPKSRPPTRLALEESNRKHTRDLTRETQRQLSDGRWLVSWEKDKPRLYEVYVLRWEW
ncbi:MAG: hypothetical protein JW908_09210 [Anaerolineales bacterium]|nr:hypothetical protein [Anaerolineales bacterium]